MTDAEKWINVLRVINRFKHDQVGYGFFIYNEKGGLMNEDDLKNQDPDAAYILEKNDWTWYGSVIEPSRLD